MLLAILFFVMGSSGYVHVQPTESPMMRVVYVVYAAILNRCGSMRALSNMLHDRERG
jgi:hypothetical protein